MGKYMRKAKTAGEVALMEVAQSSLGVRTRAKTLALQRLQSSTATAASSSGGSYLQLRSRRLEKPPIVVPSYSKRPKQSPKESSMRNHKPNPNSRTSSRLRVGAANSGSARSVSLDCLKKEGIHLETGKVGSGEDEKQEKEDVNVDLGIEASFGENVLEFEGRERGTRESTPCSLIRDPENIRTPGSTTRPTTSSEVSRRMQNSSQRQIPTTNEMDEFFGGAEEQQLSEFIEKYNFDPVNDKPLPGRYEWAKADP